MASEELPLADSLTIVAFSASVRDLLRPIVIPKKKLLAAVTRNTEKLQLYANNGTRANETKTVVLPYRSRFPVKISYKLINEKLRNYDFYVKAIISDRSVSIAIGYIFLNSQICITTLILL